MTDVNEYPIYQRKDTGHTIWFMALNWTIVGWYRTMSIYRPNTMHTSTLKFCNNIHAVKYLIKYIYKGHDRATIEISC
jgi:hypothetical protein